MVKKYEINKRDSRNKIEVGRKISLKKHPPLYIY